MAKTKKGSMKLQMSAGANHGIEGQPQGENKFMKKVLKGHKTVKPHGGPA